MSLSQKLINIREFADMLAGTPQSGVSVTSFKHFDIHSFTDGPFKGQVVVEDLDETYVVLGFQSKG